MSKAKIITEIVGLYDQIDALKRQNAVLQNKNIDVNSDNETNISLLYNNLLIAGCEKLFDDRWDVVFEYPEVFNKDTREFITFEQFKKMTTYGDDRYKKIKQYLQTMTFVDILNVVEPYLRNKYNKFVEEKRVELMKEAKE